MILQILDRVLALLEKYLPTFLAGFYLGSKEGKWKANKLRIQLSLKRIELEKTKSRAKRIHSNSSLNADDVRNQIISDAKRSLRAQSGDDPVQD
jgi:hypothetical protein